MNSNWIITLYDWSVNFLMNVATALGTTYESLNEVKAPQEPKGSTESK